MCNKIGTIPNTGVRDLTDTSSFLLLKEKYFNLFLWKFVPVKENPKELFNPKKTEFGFELLSPEFYKDWAKEASDTDLNLDLICHVAIYLEDINFL